VLHGEKEDAQITEQKKLSFVGWTVSIVNLALVWSCNRPSTYAMIGD
jgi:hypothetical protein